MNKERRIRRRKLEERRKKHQEWVKEKEKNSVSKLPKLFWLTS